MYFSEKSFYSFYYFVFKLITYMQNVYLMISKQKTNTIYFHKQNNST